MKLLYLFGCVLLYPGCNLSSEKDNDSELTRTLNEAPRIALTSDAEALNILNKSNENVFIRAFQDSSIKFFEGMVSYRDKTKELWKANFTDWAIKPQVFSIDPDSQMSLKIIPYCFNCDSVRLEFLIGTKLNNEIDWKKMDIRLKYTPSPQNPNYFHPDPP